MSKAKLSRQLTSRGLATKQRIVAAAAGIVHAKGAERMSLDEVMAATDTSRSQLYHYFDNKEALVAEVIAFQTSRILNGNASRLDSLDSRQALHGWRDMLVAANQAGLIGGCPLGSLANELSVHSEAARSQLDQSFKAWSETIEEGLRRLQDAGQIDCNVDVGALATAILAAVQGGILLSKTARNTRPLELALDMALAHIEHHATGT